MSKRAQLTTREYIISADLPEATESYTVIPHGEVIARTKELLQQKGLEIDKEYYRCNFNARVAQGMYHIKSNSDPDIGLLFAWNNSYDKSLRFRCCVGAYVHESLSTMVGNIGSWGRKHTGTANTEAAETIEEQLGKADNYFKELIDDKEKMKTVDINLPLAASFLGVCYIDKQLINTEQISIIKDGLKKFPEVFTVWDFYKTIIFALQKAHPKTWMDQQRLIHHLIMKEIIEIEITPPGDEPVVSNQLSFLEQIEQAEPPVTEPTETSTVEEDMSWPCLKCNQIQNQNDPFYEGQLCKSCFELQVEKDVVPS